MALQIESISSNETASQNEDTKRRFCILRTRPLSIVRLPHTVGWPHLVQISDIIKAGIINIVSVISFMFRTIIWHLNLLVKKFVLIQQCIAPLEIWMANR